MLRNQNVKNNMRKKKKSVKRLMSKRYENVKIHEIDLSENTVI